jgi:hypothetical protein
MIDNGPGVTLYGFPALSKNFIKKKKIEEKNRLMRLRRKNWKLMNFQNPRKQFSPQMTPST